MLSFYNTHTYRRLTGTFVLLFASCSASASAPDVPLQFEQCAPLTTHALQKDASAGQWRFYQDPFTAGHCLLISYQQPWDTSKPTQMQVMPVSLPEYVKPYLTQHALLKNTLPDRGQFKVNWLHLGYAEDPGAYDLYLSILRQPALASRVNEVMAWQHIIAQSPKPSAMNPSEFLVYQDLAIALLLAYPDTANASASNLDAIQSTRNAQHHYRYLDALYALRAQQSRMTSTHTETANMPSYLPSQALNVYQRVKRHLHNLPAEPVMTLPQALKKAEQLIVQR